jgi:rSAM/selenodomain-associated transferase 2
MFATQCGEAEASRQERKENMISAVVPTLNAASTLPATLAALAGDVGEIVVADGGSGDDTVQIARRMGARVLAAPRSRGRQLMEGVAASRGDWLLLLHADTRLGAGWAEAARVFMAATPGRAAYFRFALDCDDPRARRLERMVAWRCRRMALPYGDQGLLIARDLLHAIGGIAPLVLMEDVDLVRRLGRARLAELDVPALTSAERWQRDGWYRRSIRNLACLTLYSVGVPPHHIAKLYA